MSNLKKEDEKQKIENLEQIEAKYSISIKEQSKKYNKNLRFWTKIILTLCTVIITVLEIFQIFTPASDSLFTFLMIFVSLMSFSLLSSLIYFKVVKKIWILKFQMSIFLEREMQLNIQKCKNKETQK